MQSNKLKTPLLIKKQKDDHGFKTCKIFDLHTTFMIVTD